MNWKILLGNFVAIMVGLFLFDLLYPHGGWWQSGARISLLMAGALLGDPWKKSPPRADAQRSGT